MSHNTKGQAMIAPEKLTEWKALAGKFANHPSTVKADDNAAARQAVPELIGEVEMLRALLGKIDYHEELCSAHCGPEGEGWIKSEKCNCVLRDIRAALGAGDGEGPCG